jgi:hypothetical protein
MTSVARKEGGTVRNAIMDVKVRGCNSEMLLQWVIDANRVKVKKVGQGLIPFQRSVNIRLRDGSVVQCFHKFCQSREDALVLDSQSPKKCTSYTFNS